jgi:pyridoxal phosphate enzyme (YggS family)
VVLGLDRTVTDEVERIRARRQAIEERIVGAGGSLEGPDRVVVVAVSKLHPASACVAAVAAGLVELGESYAAELVDKAEHVAGARWHFVGQLQTNKVRAVAGRVALYQSVDRPSLIREIARRDPGARVLVQVDLAGVDGRGGCAPGDAPALVETARAAGLLVDGVMGVAPQSDDVAVGAAFARLRSLRDAEHLAVCSMGMSGDLEIAVREGSTMVRVGAALFGARP